MESQPQPAQPRGTGLKHVLRGPPSPQWDGQPLGQAQALALPSCPGPPPSCGPPGVTSAMNYLPCGSSSPARLWGEPEPSQGAGSVPDSGPQGCAGRCGGR